MLFGRLLIIGILVAGGYFFMGTLSSQVLGFLKVTFAWMLYSGVL